MHVHLFAHTRARAATLCNPFPTHSSACACFVQAWKMHRLHVDSQQRISRCAYVALIKTFEHLINTFEQLTIMENTREIYSTVTLYYTLYSTLYLPRFWIYYTLYRHSCSILYSIVYSIIYIMLYAILISILDSILDSMLSSMPDSIPYSIPCSILRAAQFFFYTTSASLPATPKYFILPPRASRLHQNILYYLREPPGDPPTTTFNVGPRDPGPRAPTNRAPLAPIGRNRTNFEPNHHFWAKVWYIRPVHEPATKSNLSIEIPVLET